MPEGNLADRLATQGASAAGHDDPIDQIDPDPLDEDPAEPAMPVMPFPTFESVPTLPQQSPGNGYQSGRDSRAR